MRKERWRVYTAEKLPESCFRKCFEHVYSASVGSSRTEGGNLASGLESKPPHYARCGVKRKAWRIRFANIGGNVTPPLAPVNARGSPLSLMKNGNSYLFCGLRDEPFKWFPQQTFKKRFDTLVIAFGCRDWNSFGVLLTEFYSRMGFFFMLSREFRKSFSLNKTTNILLTATVYFWAFEFFLFVISAYNSFFVKNDFS